MKKETQFKIEPVKNSADLPASFRQYLATTKFITQEGIEVMTGWDRKTCRKLKYLKSAGHAQRSNKKGVMVMWEYEGIDGHDRPKTEPTWGSNLPVN